MVAGTRGRGGAPSFEPDDRVAKELRLLGALGVDAASSRAALVLLAGGRYPFADLPREVVGVDGARPTSMGDARRRLSGRPGTDVVVELVRDEEREVLRVAREMVRQ